MAFLPSVKDALIEHDIVTLNGIQDSSLSLTIGIVVLSKIKQYVQTYLCLTVVYLCDYCLKEVLVCY